MIFRKLNLPKMFQKKMTTCNEVCHNNHMITLKDYEKKPNSLKTQFNKFLSFFQNTSFFLCLFVEIWCLTLLSLKVEATHPCQFILNNKSLQH